MYKLLNILETSQMASVAGVLAGIIHHSILQYPNQAALFTTLKAFFLVDTLFVVSKVVSEFLDVNALSTGTLGKIVLNLTIFNAVYISTAFILKTIYNVYFRHRGIPTKFLFAASDWPFWYIMTFQKPHIALQKLHEELGDVVRIQPNHIVFRNINAVDDIHGQNTKANKGEVYRNLFNISSYPPSVFSETNKPNHAFLRRVVSPSFGPNSLKAFEPLMNIYFNKFISGLEQRAEENNGIVEMNEWFHNLSFDITGSLSLGIDFGSLQSGEKHFFIKALQANWTFSNTFTPIAWLFPIINVLPNPQSMKQLRQKCRNFSRESVRKAIEKDNSPEARTILGYLQRAIDKDTGVRLTFDDLVINSNTMLIAGGDTVGVSLTFALYFIISLPKVWNRLSREIRQKFKSEDEITAHSTAQIQFLDAALHEALRMRPVVSGNQARETPPEGMTICGHFIPGNATVSVPHWAMMHDDRYFSNPDSFIPERWIESERGSETCVKKAWLAFSHGKRDCLGRPLALLEMRMCLAKLIWNFDITLKDPDGPEPTYDHKAFAAGKLMVRLVKIVRV